MKKTDFIREAARFLGMSGRPNAATEWYAKRHGVLYLEAAWCDMFMSWIAARLGGGDVIGEFAYTPSHVEWFKRKNAWGDKPKVGALVFYNWRDGSRAWGVPQHVGVVESIRKNGDIVAIEGNASNAVRRRVRDAHFIIGYGYPAFSGGSDTGSVPPYPGKIIYPGDSGDDVRLVKARLRELGYKKVENGPNYKKFAVNAVKDFQQKRGLEIDGRIGPDTWGELFK